MDDGDPEDLMDAVEFDEQIPTEPEEGDYTTDDFRTFYVNGKPVVTVPDDVRWQDAVAAHMNQEQYFPNVWRVSDHGNCELADWNN